MNIYLQMSKFSVQLFFTQCSKSILKLYLNLNHAPYDLFNYIILPTKFSPKNILWYSNSWKFNNTWMVQLQRGQTIQNGLHFDHWNKEYSTHCCISYGLFLFIYTKKSQILNTLLFFSVSFPICCVFCFDQNCR